MKDVIEAMEFGQEPRAFIVLSNGSGVLVNERGLQYSVNFKRSLGPCDDPLPRIRELLGCKEPEPAVNPESLDDLDSALKLHPNRVAVIYWDGSGVLLDAANLEYPAKRTIADWDSIGSMLENIRRYSVVANDTPAPPGSLCDYYRMKAKQAVENWDGQSTADLARDIYEATGEDPSKAPPLSSPELPLDRLMRLVAELEKRDQKSYAIVLRPTSHPGDIVGAVIPDSDWPADDAIATVWSDPDIDRLSKLVEFRLLSPADRLIVAASDVIDNYADGNARQRLREAIRDAKRSLSTNSKEE